MIINKRIMTVGVLGIVAISSAMFVGVSSAHPAQADGGLAGKIASKFNLNQQDVDKVIKEDREAHKAEREKAFSGKLQKLVDEGKLSSEQKSKIEAKHKEMKQQRETVKDEKLTDQERKAKMKNNHEELKKWADENNIELELVRPDRTEDSRGRHGQR